MNPSIEYEKFTQEIYQELVNADVLKTTDVQHNVKLKGRSEQEHQIDVYWEYEIAGTKQKVAIECKNYNKTVGIGKVRDFYGVLCDLNNVAGIMVTKVGYQKGAKEYASEYGISIKELRTPNPGEAIIGEVEMNFDISVRRCLFLVDADYSETDKFSVTKYKHFLDWMSLNNESSWINATHIPLELIDRNIINSNGTTITTLEKIEEELPKDSDSDIVFKYEDAYVNTRWGGRLKSTKSNMSINTQVKRKLLPLMRKSS